VPALRQAHLQARARAAAQQGRALQVDPIKPALKAPGTKHFKQEHDEQLSNFALNFNLRRYNKVVPRFKDKVGRCRLTL